MKILIIFFYIILANFNNLTIIKGFNHSAKMKILGPSFCVDFLPISKRVENDKSTDSKREVLAKRLKSTKINV